MATSTQASSPPAEVKFRMRGAECFFVEASGTVGARVSLEHFVNRSDGRLLGYFTVDGVDPDRVLAVAADAAAIDDARLVTRDVDGGLFEFVVSGPCVTTTLADTGAIARSVWAEDGVGRVVASVPPHVPVRHVVETFCERHAGADMVARHDTDRNLPIQTKRGARVALMERLTEKQREVLRVAYFSGYFAWPRRSTATDCADALGIAQSTFSQHIRVAQEKVFADLFGAVDVE